MKYRIEITTFENGKTWYSPQVKTGFMDWEYINSKYTTTSCYVGLETRENALLFIEEYHLEKESYKKRNTVKSIEREYITK
jgi:hypothetical protein